MPQVKLFGSLRLQAGIPQLDLPGKTVRTVLQNLCEGKPELSAAIFTPDRVDLRPHIRIMLNGRDIEMLQSFETQVGESDILAIIPPIAGGFL